MADKYRLGKLFVFEPNQRSLKRGEQGIDLGELAFDILAYLVNKGNAVSLQDVHANVWIPFWERHSLQCRDYHGNRIEKQLGNIRKALGDKSISRPHGRLKLELTVQEIPDLPTTHILTEPTPLGSAGPSAAGPHDDPAVNLPTEALSHWLFTGWPQHLTNIHLNHRQMKAQRFAKAFSSGEDVLLVTVMSQHNLKEIEVAHLPRAKKARTRLRVMTWNPGLPRVVVEAYRKHIDENGKHPAKTVEQVKGAAAAWKDLAAEYPNLKVRTYSSSPTMEGYFVGGANPWGVIELLPFSVQPSFRPALVLTLEADSEVFNVFRNAFEKLWSENSPQRFKRPSSGRAKSHLRTLTPRNKRL